MAKDNQILVRVNDPTNRAVEKFAEDRDYNKAEAVRKILESRLNSEGYLQKELHDLDNPVTDGGEVIEKMDDLDGKVSNLDQSIQSNIVYDKWLSNILFLSILWIGLHVSIGLGPALTIGTGGLLVIAMAYFSYKSWGETDD